MKDPAVYTDLMAWVSYWMTNCPDDPDMRKRWVHLAGMDLELIRTKYL